MNTTRLLRRVARYCADHSGSKLQSGETGLVRAAGIHSQTLATLRRGGVVGNATLDKLDNYLYERGY